jgi:hypothetical protein
MMVLLNIETPEVRTAWDKVISQYEAEGRVMTPELVKSEFLTFVGADAATQAHDALLKLVRGGVKQDASTILEYQRVFKQHIMKLATEQRPSDVLQATYFVEGLRGDLKAECMADHGGKPFASFTAAYDYALGAERRLAATQQTATKSVAVFASRSQGFKQNKSTPSAAARSGSPREQPRNTPAKRTFNSPQGPSPGAERFAAMTCNRCGQVGHGWRRCNNQPQPGWVQPAPPANGASGSGAYGSPARGPKANRK